MPAQNPKTALSKQTKARHKSLSLIHSQTYETVLSVYLILCLVFITIRTITPFINFVDTTPFKNAIGWLFYPGIALIIAGFFTSAGRKRGKGIYLLYGICLIAALSAYVYRSYGYKTNRNAILWMLIVYALFYNAAQIINRKKLHAALWIAFFPSALIWAFACCLSLYQFAHLIGSEGPNYAASPWLGGQGFFRSRLPGLFSTAEYGAVGSLMFLIWGIFLIQSTSKKLLRFLISLLCLIFFCYIVINGSRNAELALFLSVFTGAWLLSRKHFCYSGHKGRKAGLLPLCCAFGALIAVIILFLLTKKTAEHIPDHFAGIPPVETAETSYNSVNLNRPAGAEKEPVVFNAPSNNHSKAATETMPSRLRAFRGMSSASEVLRQVSAEDTKEQSIFYREEVDRDVSTGRFQIWGDYLSLYKHIGLIGLSPGNSARYIQEHEPDLYICGNIRARYPENYKRGYVFHPHNGYLKLFVSTGFLGVLCLLIFLFTNAGLVVRTIRENKDLSLEFIFSFLIVLAGGSAAMFDTELFFVMVPTTLIFWTALGVLLRIVSEK